MAARGELSPSALADEAQLDRPRTSRAIGALVAKGLLVRVPLPGDARQARVALTAAGRQLHDEVFPQVAAINQAVLEALPAVLTAIPELEIWHQTGEAEHARVQSGYAALGLTPPRARVDSFIHDMAAPYRWADLVLCRAGATSVAELAAVARPAILIPFPHAADDHQEWNARALVDVGAAVRLRQSELGEGRLADALTALLSDRERLTSMQDAMRTVARPAAAADIYDGMAALLRR